MVAGCEPAEKPAEQEQYSPTHSSTPAPATPTPHEMAAERARGIATEQGEKGRVWLDAKLAQRRQEAARREHWFESASGPTHTQGFPDTESMQRSIEAAATHGWTLETIADVPQRTVPGGLSTLLVRAAVEQVKHRSRFMVTFKRAVDGGKSSTDAHTDLQSEQP